MALTRFHYGQAYRTCFLEGLAAGLGEAEAGGGWRRGGGHPFDCCNHRDILR